MCRGYACDKPSRRYQGRVGMTYSGFVTGILALLLIGGSAYTVLAFFCVAEFFSKGRRRPDRKTFPPVSILKPVKGFDPGFRRNLESFCRQDYPEYEVIIGFVGEDDEAIPAAKALAGSYPDKVRVVITRETIGANEKVSNLKGLIAAAKYSLVAVSDCDMKVDGWYVRTIVEEYMSEDNVGMVTSPYRISSPATVGAALESLAIAVDFIPSVLVARKLEGITFGLGASMLFSVESLAEAGGLVPIADYLADDYQVGNRIAKGGSRVLLSRYVLEDTNVEIDVFTHLSHQVRWARTYYASRPGGYFGYGITHPFFFACLFVLLQGPTAASLSAVCGVLALRISLAALVHKKMIRKKGWLKWAVLLPVRDLLAFGIWAWSFAGRRVSWRGRRYRVEKGGKITRA